MYRKNVAMGVDRGKMFIKVFKQSNFRKIMFDMNDML